MIEKVWLRSAPIYEQELALLDRLPRGARLAVAAPASAIRVSATPEYHFPVLAVTLRQAFVPTLFAFPTQQPVRLMPGWGELAARTDPDRVWQAFRGRDPASVSLRGLVYAQFDAIVFVGDVDAGVVASNCLAAMGSTPGFALYRIEPQKTGCR